jgi:hypothetical protein
MDALLLTPFLLFCGIIGFFPFYQDRPRLDLYFFTTAVPQTGDYLVDYHRHHWNM